MKIKIIGCDVFFREMCLCAASSWNIVYMEFLQRGLHEKPQELKEVLQKSIDNSTGNDYEYIALAYGLCGKALSGIRARHIPIIVPRVHDCIALFLGSHERYSECFNKNPGTYYYTTGAIERGGAIGSDINSKNEAAKDKYAEYVRKYGKDNADYLMEVENGWTNNYNRAVYISFDEFNFLKYDEKTKMIAERHDLVFEEINGDMRLLKNLVDGNWNDNEFVTIKPGQTLFDTNDECIMRAKKDKDKSCL